MRVRYLADPLETEDRQVVDPDMNMENEVSLHPLL